jgi:hypothetical protein
VRASQCVHERGLLGIGVSDGDVELCFENLENGGGQLAVGDNAFFHRDIQ